MVGLYWCVIEMLREAKNYELPIDTIEDICFDFRIESSKFEALFITGLLVQDKEVFYSNSLKNRMKVKDERSRKARESAAQRWSNEDDSDSDADANAKRTQSDGNADAMQSDSEGYAKEDKIREEKRREDTKRGKKSKMEISREFYESEIEKIKDENFKAGYLSFTEFLFGKNKTGEPYKQVLSLNGQISANSLKGLLEKHPKDKIKATIETMESKDLSAYKITSFILALHNWIKK